MQRRQTFVPRYAFRVEFDFHPSSAPEELGVSAGDIVVAGDVALSKDQWIYVTLFPSGKCGFVPAGFLARISSDEAAQYIEWANLSFSAKNPAHFGSISSTPATTAPAITRLMESTVMECREKFKQIEEAIWSAEREISRCMEHNDTVLSKLDRLEHHIEEELKKLKDRPTEFSHADRIHLKGR